MLIQRNLKREEIKSITIKLFIISLFVVVFALNVTALTGNIGNARMILYPELGFFGTTIDKYILVKNVNNVSVNVSLEATEGLKDITKIIDDKFVLAAGEEKKAYFQLKIKEEGDYEGKINVFFKSAEENTAGVALSSTIIIHATRDGTGQEYNDLEEGDVTDEEDNSEQTDNENSNTITGNSISNSKSNVSSLFIILGISTLVLLIVFFMFIFIASKKKKRRDRSSWKEFYQ